ncbi:MAG: hypothetical protein J0653_06635, partial [Deltaproteobacteria bacterium]|nr:hypothetical protein [Deltaproteobacteria bacterium]
MSINSLLTGVKSIMFERARSKGILIQVETDPSLSAMRGDSTRLQQALLNYVGNAIKFTESGTVTLRTVKEQEGIDSI